ncbi:molybdate ABC transporter substrate-binding periplasmic protein [Acetobacter nitrogenifigens DSM 23921 = NBRC 105050]|uniref:Molybdate ABC transporter substrate-binding protein n=1 Tax=Acetobacter nitrogenifigens DSM 23921 = NBRC 105050 TaxID=1120919 RepID=A0A511X925_9PROT|nr:molybdate ABC transporter substrate-binding protein [Acetobacter nitrogenifigens]GBQ87043.1 molybdate ABC transporter substrate-binding periplasmic protein [Acetobacter nitrogenifigens DSM 23921 = NBRC 105050]GEN59455.1 molybdate ABC transporter substrate-binding protein [Acetobacter nitrogenifigens DSM 23921 = NBRC 105050]
MAVHIRTSRVRTGADALIGRMATVVLCALISLTAATGIARAEQARVAIAANFIGPAKALIDAFARKTGDVVTPSFGASGQFLIQIEQGAPFDAFLSADDARPATLMREGFAAPGSAFTYAIGRLALWSGSAAFPAKEETLRKGGFTRLAVGNPRTAPYGAAALATLRSLGLYDALQPRLVTGVDIAQAFQFVQTGNAELGFVALSQLHDRPPGTVWIVPASLYPPIRQDGVLLKRGEGNRAARGFMNFLQTPEAKAIIAAYGYAPV